MEFLSTYHETIGSMLILLNLFILTNKNDKIMIYSMAVIGLLWGILFLSIESNTAAVVILITTTRMLLCRKYYNNFYLTFVFISIYIIIGIEIYQSLKDIFPILGGIIGTIAFMHTRGIKMRLVLVLASMAWATHNIMAGFVSATFVEIIAICINLITAYRISLDNRSKHVTMYCGKECCKNLVD